MEIKELKFKNYFSSRVQTEWCDDGRQMELLRDFSFFDAEGVLHTAEKGMLFDGASIPRFLWTIVGSPFTGNYRKSAVIHDHLCKSKAIPSKRVHRVFYEAMLVEGVSRRKAWSMYQGVLRFGPRWSC